MSAHAPAGRWYSRPVDEVLAEVAATPAGLSEEEASRRLARDGANKLPEGRRPSFLSAVADQFRSPLIYILVAAAVLSLATGELTDAIFICAVLVLNATIGSIQEFRAERSSHALAHLVRTKTTVLRDGHVREVDAEELVVGDVIWVESGGRVGADARLLDGNLEVDESLLTGESMAVQKDASWLGAVTTPVGDRKNALHAGSVVARGRARAVVVATGVGTMVGRLATVMSNTAVGKPPLVLRLERFTRAIGIAVLLAAVAVGVVGVMRGFLVAEMFLFATALAVSAIPEGLPVALTVSLSAAARRMAARGVIVRRLATVEGLGSCTMIASDKTGTLTCNELTVREVVLPDGSVFDVSGEGYAPIGEVTARHDGSREGAQAAVRAVARVAALCNEGSLHEGDGAFAWRGDPTDVALLALARKVGIEREQALLATPEIAVIPFEPERKYAAGFHADGESTLVVVKGAPERVFEMCRWPSEADRERAVEAAAELAARGHRVLAMAERRDAVMLDAPATPAEPEALTFVGLVGMIDPLRVGVREAIARCRAAGIVPIMITGDHPLTALAIARELGLASELDEVLTGGDLSGLGEAELAAALGKVRVFARMAPEQKLAIVRAARDAGHFVAVTGDGVNDAPALRAANIGVAMGKAGTDVARDAASLVITDDNFATIVAGVEEGRTAYANVRKVIYLLVSTGAAEVVLIALSLVAGMPLPLTAVQLLWLNLVTNGIQDVALALDPGDRDVLDRPPRAPDERIFDRLMLERTLIGAGTIGLVAFAAFAWMMNAGWAEADARNATLLLMVLFENVQLGNSRSETRSLLRHSPLSSPLLLAGAAIAFLVHVAAMYVPWVQSILGTGPVSVGMFAALVAVALSVGVTIELHKLWWARRGGSGLPVDAHGAPRALGA